MSGFDRLGAHNVELSKVCEFKGFLWSVPAQVHGNFSKLVLAALVLKGPCSTGFERPLYGT